MPSLGMRGEQTLCPPQPSSQSSFTTSHSACLLECLSGENSGGSRTSSERGCPPPKVGDLGPGLLGTCDMACENEQHWERCWAPLGGINPSPVSGTWILLTD